MKNILISILIVFNLILVGFLFHKEFQRSEISLDEIKLNDSSGKPYAYIGMKGETPVIELFGKNGKPTVELVGGEKPLLRLPMLELGGENGSSQISLKDASGNPRFQMIGNPIPALFLRNEQGEIIGTFLTMENGGAGIGLADSRGNVATYLRGGEHPSLNFFQEKDEPIVSLGIAKSIPHLILLNSQGKEGILMHGGSPSSLLFINEEGKIPVIISKHGFYQEKMENPPPNKPQEKTIIQK